MSLKDFQQAYVECAFWSSFTEDGTPLDGVNADPAPDTIEKMEREAEAFYTANCDLFADDSQAGHDFWLSRNGHGAGFWDRDLGEVGDLLHARAKATGERDLLVGDDGMLYQVQG